MDWIGDRSDDPAGGLRFPFREAPQPGKLVDIGPDIKWLRMPMPLALDHINLYLLRDGAGWFAIDTGLNTETTRELWGAVLDRELAGAPLTGLLCTHFHFDHAGLAGWLTDRCGCPLYMTHGEYFANIAWHAGFLDVGGQFDAFYQCAGCSLAQAEGFRQMLAAWPYAPSRPGGYRRLRGGDRLHIGGRAWRVVIGEGHSPEHACLHNAELNILIAGDQVLPGITSNVMVGPVEPEGNPLGDWLASIARLRRLPEPTLVLPAHELPFTGLHPRLGQLATHHRAHLKVLTAACKKKEATALALTKCLFPKLKSRFDEMMGLGETLAHLNYSLAKGKLARRLDRDDVAWYGAA